MHVQYSTFTVFSFQFTAKISWLVSFFFFRFFVRQYSFKNENPWTEPAESRTHPRKNEEKPRTRGRFCGLFLRPYLLYILYGKTNGWFNCWLKFRWIVSIRGDFRSTIYPSQTTNNSESASKIESEGFLLTVENINLRCRETPRIGPAESERDQDNDYTAWSLNRRPLRESWIWFVGE